MNVILIDITDGLENAHILKNEKGTPDIIPIEEAREFVCQDKHNEYLMIGTKLCPVSGVIKTKIIKQ